MHSCQNLVNKLNVDSKYKTSFTKLKKIKQMCGGGWHLYKEDDFRNEQDVTSTLWVTHGMLISS